MIDNSKFAYSVGRIRVLETSLLNQNEVERMIGAPNAENAFRILNELDFSSHLDEVKEMTQFQKILDAGLLDIKNILIKIAPYQWFLNILWYYYDIHNIKLILKANLLEKNQNEIKNFYSKLGIIDLEILEKLIFDEEKESLNLPLNDEKIILKEIIEIKKEFAKEKDPQIIDLRLDKIYLKLCFNISKKLSNNFITNFITNLKDLYNINIFIRAKIQNKDSEFLEKSLATHGTLNKKFYLNMFKDDLDSFITSTKNSVFASLIQKSLTYYKKNNSLLKFDKLADDYQTNFIKKAKIITFGPEPLLSYFWAKKNNAQIIRMIMVNKLNGASPDEIRERVRELYI